MSPFLRAEMIVLALLIVTIIVRSVNRKKLRIQYSFAWLVIAAALLAVAFFPALLCGCAASPGSRPRPTSSICSVS
ncbi:MAG: DUF2304 family protein [Lawsonibacter sp.]|nr:DUF2304 family protein [Lawsonibacter sp.]